MKPKVGDRVRHRRIGSVCEVVAISSNGVISLMRLQSGEGSRRPVGETFTSYVLKQNVDYWENEDWEHLEGQQRSC